MQYPVYIDCKECFCFTTDSEYGGSCNLKFDLNSEAVDLDDRIYYSEEISKNCELGEIKDNKGNIIFIPKIIEWQKMYKVQWDYKPGFGNIKNKVLLYDKTSDQGE